MGSGTHLTNGTLIGGRGARAPKAPPLNTLLSLVPDEEFLHYLVLLAGGTVPDTGGRHQRQQVTRVSTMEEFVT